MPWTLGDFVRACLFFDHVEDLARAVGPRAVYYVTMWETIEDFNGNSQCIKLQPNESTIKTVFGVHMTFDASFPTGFRSAYQWNWKIYKNELGQGSHTGTTRWAGEAQPTLGKGGKGRWAPWWTIEGNSCYNQFNSNKQHEHTLMGI